jgi:LysM domain
MVSSLDSAATARPTDAAAARPDDTTQHDQRFDVALKKAKSDRTGADRHRHSKPDEITQALKPGETLWSIAKQYRAPFSEVVRANRQFRNPHHIAPGKAVHIPHPDPRVVSMRQAVANAHRADDGVSALQRTASNPNAATGERSPAPQQLPEAQAQANRQWTDIQHSVEAEIRNAGRGATFPDDATRSVVAELRGRMPEDARYQATVGQAVATVDGEWRNAGITRGEIDGLVHNAHAADQSVAFLDQLQRAPGATPAQRQLAASNLHDARNAADAAWGKVGTEVEDYLRSQGTGRPYPEQLVRQHVDDISKQYARDPKVKSAVDSAYRTVINEWQAQGWTHDTLGKIVGQYDVVNKDQRAVTTAQASASANLPALQTQLDRDRTTLRQEIERQLDDVAGGGPPDQREMAIGARAALIQQNGPGDQAFADIVDEAAYNKVVQPGVDAVRNAYQSGGAKAAAEALRQQTENVSPATAARIVEASPTISNIAADIKGSLTEGGPIASQDVAGVYANVATATDYAARSTNGAQITADMARVMVREMPSRPVLGYRDAVLQSVSSGTGATLALEMTAQLKQAGRTDEAASLLGMTRVGIEVLGNKIKKGVREFREASADVNQLRVDWAPMMTRDQLDQATVRYVAQHSDILPNFDRTYDALNGLGYGAARTGLALAAAFPRLQGLDGVDDLAKVRSDFAGAQETQIAVGLSEKANGEVLRIVVDQTAGGGPAGANPTSPISRARNFVKEFVNSRMSSSPSSMSAIMDLEASAGPAITARPVQDIFTGQNIKVDPKKTSLALGTLNGIGTAFNGYQAVLAWQNLAQAPGRLLDLTKAVYYTVGFGKEAAELLSVGAQRGWFALDSIMPANLSGSILAKANRTGLALEPGWPKFATYFKIGGGLIDGALAVDAMVQGDWVAAGLYTTSAAGGVLMGAGSVATGGSALATLGGPIGGALVVVSALGLYLHDDAKAKARMERPSREFLEVAGYKPEIARALADYSDWDGHSAGPAIGATAQKFGRAPDQLMARLNRLDPTKVHDLVTKAWGLTANEGRFALIASNDRHVWAPGSKDPQFGGGTYLYDPQDKQYRGYYAESAIGYLVPVEDPVVRSMTALRDYARALFGEPVLE